MDLQIRKRTSRVERKRIFSLWMYGLSVRTIAKEARRSPTTVRRCVKRLQLEASRQNKNLNFRLPAACATYAPSPRLTSLAFYGFTVHQSSFIRYLLESRCKRNFFPSAYGIHLYPQIWSIRTLLLHSTVELICN